MALAELLGFTAAICTTLAFLPQAIQTIKTRQTAGLSLLMLTLQSSGCFLWIIYGLWIRSPSITVANIITTAIVATVLWVKYKTDRYGSKKN